MSSKGECRCTILNVSLYLIITKKKNKNKKKNKQTLPRLEPWKIPPSPDPWFLSVGPTEIPKLWRLGVPFPRFFLYNCASNGHCRSLNIKRCCLTLGTCLSQLSIEFISQFFQWTIIKIRRLKRLRT
jgi:hypothetical protein